MSNIVSTLPEFPEYDDYILTQQKNGDYLLLAFYNGESVTVNSNGEISKSGGYHYKLSDDGESWEMTSICHGGHSFTSNGSKPLFSTVDCYNVNGGLIYSGSLYIPPVSFVGVMSSSDMLFSALSDIRFLVPLVAVVTLGVIGFRKALFFLSGLLRGA